MEYTLELTDNLVISVVCIRELGDHFTLELEDELHITIGSFIRGGNNIRLSFEEDISIAVELNSAYFIRRAADLAHLRTNYP